MDAAEIYKREIGADANESIECPTNCNCRDIVHTSEYNYWLEATVERLYADRDRLQREVEAMRLKMPKVLARNQPCGCVICVCEDDRKCHGCGAKMCGKDDCVFKTNGAVYEAQAGKAVG